MCSQANLYMTWSAAQNFHSLSVVLLLWAALRMNAKLLFHWNLIKIRRDCLNKSFQMLPRDRPGLLTVLKLMFEMSDWINFLSRYEIGRWSKHLFKGWVLTWYWLVSILIVALSRPSLYPDQLYCWLKKISIPFICTFQFCRESRYWTGIIYLDHWFVEHLIFLCGIQLLTSLWNSTG